MIRDQLLNDDVYKTLLISPFLYGGILALDLYVLCAGYSRWRPPPCGWIRDLWHPRELATGHSRQRHQGPHCSQQYSR